MPDPNSGHFDISNLLKLCSSRFDQAHIDEIHRAYSLAKQAHCGQYRKSGEDYIYHPIAVAKLVFDLGMDQQSVIAALLHDVVEDTPVTRQEIVDMFGENIAHIVDGLSKLENINLSDRAERQAANFRKMILAMIDDIRIIIIKLCDRTHNMRTIASMAPEPRRRIARETLDVYAPIAHRLGIDTIKNELEDLGFLALYPARHRVIGAQIKKARANHSKIINKIEVELTGYLSDSGITAKIISREKNLYSLYLKMKKKQLAFKEVYDMFGLRIVVDTPDTCYRVLGILHRFYKPRINLFKDYISIPKENGYQSLHTVVLGRDGVAFEAQIRTLDMEKYANSGVAAHWAYKSDEPTGKLSRATEWLNKIKDYQATSEDTLEFYENVKLDLFPSEIYVFTPNGDIYRLPAKATVIDFAYAVHSKIGKHCYGAQIDDKPSPLSARLLSGQKVRIITKEFAQPQPEWLEHIVTPRARNEIRRFLRSQGAENTQERGRKKLDAALRMSQSSLAQVSEEKLNELLDKDSISSLSALFLEIGLGNRTVHPIANKLIESITSEPGGGPSEPEPNFSPNSSEATVVVDGNALAYANPAKCCFPLPGDDIRATRSNTNHITIHRKECSNTRHMHKRPDQWVEVQWGQTPDKLYSTNVTVEMKNIPGSLNQVSGTLTHMGINIENIQFHNRGDRYAVLTISILVEDQEHLAKVIRKLRNTPAVNRAERRLES